jgi:hypothetical protein
MRSPSKTLQIIWEYLWLGEIAIGSCKLEKMIVDAIAL